MHYFTVMTADGAVLDVIEADTDLHAVRDVRASGLVPLRTEDGVIIVADQSQVADPQAS